MPTAIHLLASDFPAQPQSFFARPAEVVAPDLVGCRLVKRQDNGSLVWGVIVETEAYSQDDPACHGYRRRSPRNSTRHCCYSREAAASISQHSAEKRLPRSWSVWRQSSEDHHHSPA